MPAGNVLRISSSRVASRAVTSWLFSPISMKPRPSTTSPLPSAVTAPRRISRPSTTSATSRMRTGTPSFAATITSSISRLVRDDADALDQGRLAGLVDRAAADVGVVALQRFDDVRQREPARRQRHRIDDDLELLLVAAPRVDLGDARHGDELRADDPVLHRSQLGGALALARDHVVKHLAEAGRHRPELRPLDAARQLHRVDALVDDLAREIDVGAVLEQDGHLREAELRDRAHLLESGQSRRSPARPGW